MGLHQHIFFDLPLCTFECHSRMISIPVFPASNLAPESFILTCFSYCLIPVSKIFKQLSDYQLTKKEFSMSRPRLQQTCLIFRGFPSKSESEDRLYYYACLFSSVPPTFAPNRSHPFFPHILSSATESRRPGRKWEDNIKINIHRIRRGIVDWIYLTQDSSRAFMNTVMNLLLPTKGRQYLL
jgi:hypothetical protein